MNDELDRQRQCVAATPGGGETPAPMEGHPSRRGPEHGVREGAGGDLPPPRDTRPDRATRFIETALGTLAYSELAPILAERVLRVEEFSVGEPAPPPQGDPHEPVPAGAGRAPGGGHHAGLRQPGLRRGCRPKRRPPTSGRPPDRMVRGSGHQPRKHPQPPGFCGGDFNPCSDNVIMP